MLFTGKLGRMMILDADGQFFEVAFHSMDLTAPLGRNRPDEILRLNRGRLDGMTHYVQGLDDPNLEPLTLSFSCILDDTVNKEGLIEALTCGTVGSVDWPSAGTSTKATSKVPDGLNGTLVPTPPFTDDDKKTVTVQVEWEAPQSPGDEIFWEWNEVYFRPMDITINEAADAVRVNVTGSVYGSIRDDLTEFGYRTELP